MARSGSPALVSLVIALVAVAGASVMGCAPKHDRSNGEAAGNATGPSVVSVVSVPTSVVPAGPPPPPPLERPLRVIVGGDLLPHRPSLIAPAAIQASLAPLGELFGKADAVVANYEAATGEVDPNAFRLAYAAPRGWMGALPTAGIRAVTVANNHACDLGEPGLLATLDEAAKAKLLAIGGDATDPWAPRVIASEGGKRICAVAWTTLSNAADGACASGRHLAIAPLTGMGKVRIDRAMAKARAQCDATIAIFHGGNEYAPQTTLVMDQAAHAAEAGAVAVVVHHPHIASPVTVLTTRDGRHVPLFASVGNLVTNQGESWKPPMFPVLRENRHLVCVNGWTRLGVLADFSFTFDAAGKAPPHLDWGMHLLWIDNEHADDRTVATPKITARLLDPAKDRAIVENLTRDAQGPIALFSDPCWFEREPGSPEGAAAARDPRCATELTPNGQAAAAVAEVRHNKRHARGVTPRPSPRARP